MKNDDKTLGLKNELLIEIASRVLEIEPPDSITSVKRNRLFNNIEQTLVFSYNDGSEPIEINIYEFMHYYKIFLRKHNFFLWNGTSGWKRSYEALLMQGEDQKLELSVHSDDEFNAVFSTYEKFKELNEKELNEKNNFS